MRKSGNGRAKAPMTIEAASRFYRAEAKRGGGQIAAGSAAARVMGVAMRNERPAVGRDKGKASKK